MFEMTWLDVNLGKPKSEIKTTQQDVGPVTWYDVRMCWPPNTGSKLTSEFDRLKTTT